MKSPRKITCRFIPAHRRKAMRNNSRRETPALAGFVILALAMILATPTYAQEVERVLTLSAIGLTTAPFGHTGQSGEVQIEAEPGKTSLDFSLTGLTPNAVHGVWLILDTGAAPFVSCTGPKCSVTDPITGTTSTSFVFPFTPAAADNAGFTAGNGLDPNGFVTDGSGNVEFQIKLNYNIFDSAVAPVVLNPGVTQAVGVAPSAGPTCAASGSTLPSVIDSGFMRVFDTTTIASLPGTSPAFQMLDAPLKPRLVRANVKAIVVVEHFDGLTHGHRPGLHVGNPAFAACGDFDNRLSGNLADAVNVDSYRSNLFTQR